jgi:hypothetical protein
MCELVNKPPEQPVAEPLDPRQRIDVRDNGGAQVEPVPLAPAKTGPQAAQLVAQHGVIAIQPDVIVVGIAKDLLAHRNRPKVQVEQAGFQDELHDFGAEVTCCCNVELGAVEGVFDA